MVRGSPESAFDGTSHGVEALRRALSDKQFVVHYQPKILLADERIAGVEALVRWQHPSGGLLPADRFIDLAERTGLIKELGAWVLEEACRQGQELQAHFPGRRPLVVAVNVSAGQFETELVGVVAEILDRTRVDPSLLCLELPESIIMSDVEPGIEILQQLKALGVRLSIDDFGTGQSSLGHLRRFPIDELKIDHTFVDGLSYDVRDTAIVAAVVAMAHALKVEVVAKGVESREQLERLQVLGCGQAQGYYFSAPVSAAALATLLVGEDGALARRNNVSGGPGGYHRDVVLVADDCPDVRELAAVSLRAVGFEVHEADNGRAALQLAHSVNPSCVILDVGMPEIDGIEACRALRAEAAMVGCTIIMLTARAESADKVAGFSAGADDYIVKPFAPRDLVGRVKAALCRRKAL